MENTTQPTPRFSWPSAGRYMLLSAAVLVVCHVVTWLLAHHYAWPWVTTGSGDMTLAIGCGIFAEYLRVGRARRELDQR